MASSNAENQVVEDPDYIKRLLNPKDEYDWYFVVGNGKNNTPVERIGVVKKMLLAHSEVFRRELHESPLKEKNDTEITDIFPDTFKNLLRYIYGFNQTACLTFDEADDLLYAADKYMMDKLKTSLASRLMDLLSYENICSLMNNRACYQVLELNSEITKIIQFETKKVLASPQFLDMCPEAFLTILQQEKLQVPEIELWRSAVQWAKKRAKSDGGRELRKQLKTHLPHIRVCTVPLEDFCRDIVSTDILTNSETVQICKYQGNKDQKPDLPKICDITQCRKPTKLFEKSELIKFNMASCASPCDSRNEWSCDIITSKHSVELCSLGLYNYKGIASRDVTVEIRQVDCAEPPPPVPVTARVQAPNYTIDFPASSEYDEDSGGSVILLPNSKYKVTFSSPSSIDFYYYNSASSISSNNGTLVVNSLYYSGYHTYCINTINYKTLTRQ